MSATYEQFYNAAKNAGLYGQFSAEDLELARKYPDFGLSILSLKKEWNGASTPEAKAAANAAANELRRSYGGYSGGGDGINVTSAGLSPASYRGVYNDAIDSLLSSAASYGGFSYGAAPKYDNRYDSTQQALLSKIIDREPFSYDAAEDPSYAAYKKEYLREGQRAARNAVAETAARSAGIPSSYAATAASQAADYYAAKLSDALPTLYQQAFERYMDEQGLKYRDLSAVNDLEQADYSKYQQQLKQYNADRDQSYKEYLDRYDMLMKNIAAYEDADDRAYGRTLDQIEYNAAQAAAEAAERERQQELALELWKTGGYATDDIASVLGIPAGTATSAQASKDAKGVKSSKSSSAKSGSKTVSTPSAPAASASDHYEEVWEHAADMFMGGYNAEAIGNYLTDRKRNGWINANEESKIKGILRV